MVSVLKQTRAGVEVVPSSRSGLGVPLVMTMREPLRMVQLRPPQRLQLQAPCSDTRLCAAPTPPPCRRRRSQDHHALPLPESLCQPHRCWPVPLVRARVPGRIIVSAAPKPPTWPMRVMKFRRVVPLTVLRNPSWGTETTVRLFHCRTRWSRESGSFSRGIQFKLSIRQINEAA